MAAFAVVAYYLIWRYLVGFFNEGARNRLIRIAGEFLENYPRVPSGK